MPLPTGILEGWGVWGLMLWHKLAGIVRGKFPGSGGLPSMFKGSKCGNDPSLQINKSRITVSCGWKCVCVITDYAYYSPALGKYV